MRGPVVAIHQPNYLPWLGWFAKAAQADILVLLDDVQFEKGGYTNRVEVKTAAGRTRLTVPVHAAGSSIPRVNELEIATEHRWAPRHAKTLEQSYGSCPGWRAYGGTVVEAIASKHSHIAVLNERLIGFLFEVLHIDTKVLRASEMATPRESGSAGLVEICRRVGAGTYLSGAGGRNYNDPKAFAAAGIDVLYSAFVHPDYAQPHGAFETGLSSVDLLFSAPGDAAALLRAGIGEPVR